MIENPSQIPVGTRVTYTGPGPIGRTLTEETGTVIEVNADNGVCGVRFDRHISGHTLDGTCDHGYGWFCMPSNLTIAAPLEPVVGSRVRVNGHVGGVGEVYGEGTVVVISDENVPVEEPLGVRFDDRVEYGHDLDHHGEAMCPDGYGLWVGRGIVTVISGGPSMPVAAPATNSQMFAELFSSPTDSNDTVPGDVLEGTYTDVCRHLLTTNGVGATPHEHASLVTLIKGIRQRWSMQSMAGKFASKLAEVDF